MRIWGVCCEAYEFACQDDNYLILRRAYLGELEEIALQHYADGFSLNSDGDSLRLRVAHLPLPVFCQLG